MFIVVYYDPESKRIETEESVSRIEGQERVNWLADHGATAELLIVHTTHTVQRDTWKLHQR